VGFGFASKKKHITELKKKKNPLSSVIHHPFSQDILAF
jgi:hypothetical protein